MYFDLDKMPIKKLERRPQAYRFIYDDQEYFFKEASDQAILKELVAEKIANRFGIPCCHYMPAIYHERKGVVSESALNTNYISIGKYLKDVYGLKKDYLYCNNLEDLWNAFYLEFPNETVKRLMDEITDIFIFDVLIGNFDRHGENYGLIRDGAASHIAPIYDNASMLSYTSINMGLYNLDIESSENSYYKSDNSLYNFLDFSDKSYQERLKEGLKIISEESLTEIFQELENEGIALDTTIVDDMLENFALNRDMINDYFQRKNSSKH